MKAKLWCFIVFFCSCYIQVDCKSNVSKKSISKRSYDISNVDLAGFAQSIFFNTIGSSIPLGWFLSATISLFKSGIKGTSIVDQLREEIKTQVLQGVTNYHQDVLYNKMVKNNSTIGGIYSRTLKNEPEKFLEQLVKFRLELFDSKHEFFPDNFYNSIGYNESLLLYMSPFIIQYMSVSYEIDNWYNNQSRPIDGALQTNLEERYKINHAFVLQLTQVNTIFIKTKHYR